LRSEVEFEVPDLLCKMASAVRGVEDFVEEHAVGKRGAREHGA
jgi:hypothetical protein